MKQKGTTEATEDPDYRKRPPSVERGAQTSHVATSTTTTTSAPFAAHPMVSKLCTEQPRLFASPGVGNCDGTIHVSLPPLFATLATVRCNECCCEGARPTERPQSAAVPTEVATAAPPSQSPFPAILLPSDPPEDASDSAQRAFPPPSQLFAACLTAAGNAGTSANVCACMCMGTCRGVVIRPHPALRVAPSAPRQCFSSFFASIGCDAAMTSESAGNSVAVTATGTTRGDTSANGSPHTGKFSTPANHTHAPTETDEAHSSACTLLKNEFDGASNGCACSCDMRRSASAGARAACYGCEEGEGEDAATVAARHLITALFGGEERSGSAAAVSDADGALRGLREKAHCPHSSSSRPCSSFSYCHNARPAHFRDSSPPPAPPTVSGDPPAKYIINGVLGRGSTSVVLRIVLNRSGRAHYDARRAALEGHLAIGHAKYAEAWRRLNGNGCEAPCDTTLPQRATPLDINSSFRRVQPTSCSPFFACPPPHIHPNNNNNNNNNFNNNRIPPNNSHLCASSQHRSGASAATPPQPDNTNTHTCRLGNTNTSHSHSRSNNSRPADDEEGGWGGSGPALDTACPAPSAASDAARPRANSNTLSQQLGAPHTPTRASVADADACYRHTHADRQ